MRSIFKVANVALMVFPFHAWNSEIGYHQFKIKIKEIVIVFFFCCGQSLICLVPYDRMPSDIKLFKKPPFSSHDPKSQLILSAIRHLMSYF